MTDKNFINNTKKAAVTGAIAYAGAKFILGAGGDKIDFYGTMVDPNMLLGVAAAAGSLTAATASGYILPMVSPSNAAAYTEGKILQPAAVGAATYLAARMVGNVPSSATALVVGLGAASEVGSAYAIDALMGDGTGDDGWFSGLLSATN